MGEGAQGQRITQEEEGRKEGKKERVKLREIRVKLVKKCIVRRDKAESVNRRIVRKYSMQNYLKSILD